MILVRLSSVLLCCIVIFTALFSGLKRISSVSALAGEKNHPVIIIDAGHGGIDPGAVGKDGTVEKEINLDISKKLQSILTAFGFDTVMTRTDDSLICDDGLSSVKEKKHSDITKRLEICENTNDSVLVSIHQNNFSQSRYYGVQLFFSTNNEESKLLADSLQKSIINMIQPENSRLAKPVGKEIYLLYHCQRPAVMVECGFMSNINELELLKTDDYRNKMAFSIALGLYQFYC